MTIPSYRFFIEPVLRHLASSLQPVSVDTVHAAAAGALGLNQEERDAEVSSGKKKYKDRAGWALNTLKHLALAQSPSLGTWEITDAGRQLAAAKESFSDQEVRRLIARVRSRRGTREPRVLDVSTPGGDRKAYKLQPRPIASGGQAEVYEATRKTDGSVVAFKRVREPSGAARMRREIEVQLMLSHENVMPILDWDANTYCWYTMPRGARTMAQLVPPLEVDFLLSLVRAVAAGLEHAHAAGYPHRDVKPHNIIEVIAVDGQSRWLLADWGLTRPPLGDTRTPLTRTGDVLGTEGFAPPEAYTDPHSYDRPGDVFALGQVIAWATGSRPIPNAVGKAPEPWRELVAEMTQLSPKDRIQTMTEVRARLERMNASVQSSE